MKSAFRIVSYPNYSNPYLGLFYDALHPHGVEWVGELKPSVSGVWSRRRECDAYHIHWPERLWSKSKIPALSLVRFLAVLLATRMLGISLIWTVHNLDPHEGGGWINRMGQRLLGRYADLVLVHSEHTEVQLRERARVRGRVAVMKHGNYKGYYPPPRPRNEVLETFGLDGSKPILACMGLLREYKGFDLACVALNQFKGEFQLVIAGPPHSTEVVDELRMYERELPDLLLHMRRVTDQEFSDLLSVSAAALLPYRRITGSGMLLAAWTQGCGVIASDLGFFREMIPAGSAAGRLFEAGNPESLAAAIKDYLRVPASERQSAALAMAERYSWDQCVEAVGPIFQRWSEKGKRN